MIFDYLRNIIEPDPRLTIEELAEFFDQIPQEQINYFTYQKRDGTLIGIKEYFKAYHHGQTSRYRKSEKTIAQNNFLMIYRGAAWNILQIRNEQKWLEELTNLEKNWRDATEHEGKGTSTQDNTTKIEEDNTHTDRRGVLLGNLTGQLDAAQLSRVDIQNLLDYSKEKVLGFLDPNTRSRSHAITIEGGENKNIFTNRNTTTGKITGNNTNNTKTYFSNTSKDLIDVINLKMPELLQNFLDKFSPLFLY